MDMHYAIGDIHGRDDLLEALHERIAADHALRHKDERAILVYLGDYIDRGARSPEVIDRVMRGLPNFESVCLKGNHEEMMMDCTTTDDRFVWSVWLENGGDEVLTALGLRVERNPVALAKALGSRRLEWLDTLKLTYRAGPYFFVHAGIVPGVPLEEQEPKDLLWIRRRFLNSDEDHGVVVVHGHTPSQEPELRANRINVDTGATWNGKLTAVALGEAEGPRFLTVTGEPGRGPATS